MSVNLYQTGVSGLLAAQQQLATTSHNIANVNTEGYNRQRAEQETSIANPLGNNFLGGGTFVQDVTRIYDQFAYKEQLLNQSNKGSADASYASLNQLNEIMSFSGNAVMGSIERFYQAMNGVADNPSDLGLRNIALTQAEILATDFTTLNENFDQLEKFANNEIDQVAKQISEISVEISKINEAVLQNQTFSNKGQPNDLLDKRDALISQLGEYTKVNTITDQNGVMTVMIGGGNTLVAGITPLTVEVNAGDPDANQTTLSLVGPNSKVSLDERTIGGSLGAKISFRDNDLMKVRSEINRLAMGISETINSAQADGLDLNAQQGANIFTDINSPTLTASRVLTPTTNVGSQTAEVVITDVSLVPTQEFTIEYDGTDYIMTNELDGSTVNLGPASATTYNTTYGFDFVETNPGPPAAGDQFVIRPTENSASLMSVTLQDGSAIAASTPVGIVASENNVSPGEVKVADVTDPEAARNFTSTLNNGLRVDVYLNGGNYDYRVYDNGTTPPNPPSVAGAITSGSFPVGGTGVIDLPPAPGPTAFQIEISGTPDGQGPLAPEVYEITDAFGIGNGQNAVSMALTQEKGILNNGRETFTQSLGISTSDVGSKASSAELVADTAEAMYTQAYNRVQATSGVNLDEEAANLIRFQQAYQAASQVISSANTIFDTLLSVAR